MTYDSSKVLSRNKRIFTKFVFQSGIKFYWSYARIVILRKWLITPYLCIDSRLIAAISESPEFTGNRLIVYRYRVTESSESPNS